MTFCVRNQEELEQLCCQVPLPSSIKLLMDVATLDERQVPFICHDGLKALLVGGKRFLNFPQTQSNRSTVKRMFVDSLSNSTSVESLELWDVEICGLLSYLLHRRPVLDSLTSISLEFTWMERNEMLLFGRAVKLSQSLHTVQLFGSESTTDAFANSTVIANVLCSLLLSHNLKSIYLWGGSFKLFSTLRLALVHKLLNEANYQWSSTSLAHLDQAFVVKQIVAQLARRPISPFLQIDNEDWELLPTTQRDYISSGRIFSGFLPTAGFTYFISKRLQESSTSKIT